MKYIILISSLILTTTFFPCSAQKKSIESKLHFYAANNKYIQYTGRIQFDNPLKPRFWAGGVYITARFKGTACEVIVTNEFAGNNYLEIVIDKTKAYRVKTEGKTDTIQVASGLSNEPHTLTICKNTESNNGYLEFIGLRCSQLLSPLAKPVRKLEFIGNSITSGASSDLSEIPCGKGKWHDQHNAYFSYGPTTARLLNSQWHLTSYSGIGLTHSCCNIKTTMPQVFNKVNLSKDSISWDFSRYTPDAVTICLGQNDGIQDSTLFCTTYINFIHKIRNYYPHADIICLTSPMADSALVKVMKIYLTGIVDQVNKEGDRKVYKYFFSKRYHHGCDEHPDLAEHKEIAHELASFLKKQLDW
ncbi:SGNH/GDSL hydrolase family protein [Rubrolithibacter danxiaensis]|uniref:SGNH/GDSL hydrolase family protein n=1 Tax=Rubrolithibacter danxiaensis TaxID=3390805 RepID=UPI003BF876BB